LLLLGQVQGTHDLQDTWLGLTAPYSGQHALGVAGSVVWQASDGKDLLLRLQRNLWEKSLDSEIVDPGEEIEPYLVISLGMNWLLGG
jgi:hypothetical protein